MATTYTEGAKYTKGQNLRDVAAAVRKDIKAAVKSGALPAGLRCSVRISRYSGGQSLRVKVQAVPFEIANAWRVEGEYYGDRGAEQRPRLSDEATALESALRAIVREYNYCRSYDFSRPDRDFLAFVDFEAGMWEASAQRITGAITAKTLDADAEADAADEHRGQHGSECSGCEAYRREVSHERDVAGASLVEATQRVNERPVCSECGAPGPFASNPGGSRGTGGQCHESGCSGHYGGVAELGAPNPEAADPSADDLESAAALAEGRAPAAVAPGHNPPAEPAPDLPEWAERCPDFDEAVAAFDEEPAPERPFPTAAMLENELADLRWDPATTAADVASMKAEIAAAEAAEAAADLTPREPCVDCDTETVIRCGECGRPVCQACALRPAGICTDCGANADDDDDEEPGSSSSDSSGGFQLSPQGGQLSLW
jgi:hypothetical protein